MKRGLTQKQLIKGIKHLDNAIEFLHFCNKEYSNYKRATKGWVSCCGATDENFKILYNEILDSRKHVAQLQRKYL